MFDLGWTEMLVIAVVAIVVIGPKELPRALRTAGQLMGKARGLARDFQRHIDDMVRESDLEDLRKKANSIKDYDPSSLLDDDEDPTGGKPAPAPEPAKPSIAPAHSLGDAHGKPAASAEASSSAPGESSPTPEDAPKAATGGG